MNRIRRYGRIYLFLLLLCTGLLSLPALRPPPLFQLDTVAVSRIAAEVGMQWAALEKGESRRLEDAPYDYSVVDITGRLLYQSAPDTVVSPLDGVRRQDVSLNVVVEGRAVGTVLVSTHLNERIKSAVRHSALLLLSAFTAMGALSLGYYFFLWRSMVRPFKHLERISNQIAGGNLDVPLQMDKNHLFGAFTEAFDIMRTQLLQTRDAQRRESQSKKELVASLSHDIKTPVTSIRLISELLLVSVKEEAVAARLRLLYEKADQIDRLVSDLFHSTLEELGEMQVRTEETKSTALIKIIQDCDFEDRIVLGPIPDCLIRCDPLRLEQVVGNILSNSYKYAGTPIAVSAALTDGYLLLSFEDSGPGVCEEELPLLLEKFYRGKDAQSRQKEGAGLGLYISKSLMERMGAASAAGAVPADLRSRSSWR